MWCCRRMEKISWTDHVRKEEVLLRVNEQRNILQEIRKRKANCIGHIWCRYWLARHFIEGKVEARIEVTRRRGRRRRRLLNDLKIRILENERRGTRSHNVGNLLWKRLLSCRETE